MLCIKEVLTQLKITLIPRKITYFFYVSPTCYVIPLAGKCVFLLNPLVTLEGCFLSFLVLAFSMQAPTNNQTFIQIKSGIVAITASRCSGLGVLAHLQMRMNVFVFSYGRVFQPCLV